MSYSWTEGTWRSAGRGVSAPEAEAAPAAGTRAPLMRATAVASSSALRPVRSDPARPEAEEGMGVMLLIYRQKHGYG